MIGLLQIMEPWHSPQFSKLWNCNNSRQICNSDWEEKKDWKNHGKKIQKNFPNDCLGHVFVDLVQVLYQIYKLLLRTLICHFCSKHGHLSGPTSPLFSMCKPRELSWPWPEAGSDEGQLKAFHSHFTWVLAVPFSSQVHSSYSELLILTLIS